VNGSPTEVVATAFSALESEDWSRLAELTHPDALAEYRSHQIAFLLAWAEYLSKDESVRGGGFGSSGEIKPELLARFADQELDWVPEHPTIGELAALSPKNFFARWMRAGYRERPLAGRRLPGIPRQILGAVSESERLAHVVYRGMEWMPGEAIHVMSLSRADGDWLLMQNMETLKSPRLPTPGREP
jgi:hypothetical protein